MNLYRIDVKIIATAYIKANSQEEAERMLAELEDGVELFEEERGELAITGREYDDPRLPNLSISPAITVSGPCVGAEWEIAEHDVEPFIGA